MSAPVQGRLRKSKKVKHTHTNRHNAQHRQSGTEEKRRKPKEKTKKGEERKNQIDYLLFYFKLTVDKGDSVWW